MWAFFFLFPFGAAAAFNLPALGNATIGLVELATVVLFLIITMVPDGPNRLAGSVRVDQPGFILLLLFVFSAFSAIFFPVIFSGDTIVFSLSRSANSDGIISVPLGFGTGNITQLFKMLLSTLAFFSFATILRVQPNYRAVLIAITVATSVNALLGWIDVMTASAGLGWILDPIRSANYTMHVSVYLAGVKRMVGGFPEASTFGTFSLVLFAFWLHYWSTSGRSRVAGLMLALSGIALLRSTSSGAYVALVIFVMIYGGYMAVSRIRPSLQQRSSAIAVVAFVVLWMAGLALIASYQLADPVTQFLDRALFDKVGSDSGVERMSWNTQAYRNFTDTWAMGAGLGSIRASNWLLASLGSFGLIGTAIYIGFLVSFLRTRPPAQDPEMASVATALKVACLALFISSMLTATLPNLGILFFSLAGMATGLSRGAVLRANPRGNPAQGGARSW